MSGRICRTASSAAWPILSRDCTGGLDAATWAEIANGLVKAASQIAAMDSDGFQTLWAVDTLRANGIRVSMFIEPTIDQITASHLLGAEMVELHTGAFANAEGDAQTAELARLCEASEFAHALGLQVNAGHGINYTNIALIRTVPHLVELNIGHSIVCRAVFTGLDAAVREMVAALP